MEDLSAERTLGGGAGARKHWALREGETLGGYRFVRPLGRGGMGEVYLAENVETGVRYALKLLPADLASDPGFHERFRREAAVLQTLRHDAIVMVHHAAREGGRFFLTMDYVDGGSLDERLKAKGRLGEHETTRIALQICGALAYAHGKGIVHRDVKPANVLLDAEGRAKLSDFGLARVVGDDFLRSMTERSASLSMQRTDGGLSQSDSAIIGTYEYMSPEQKAGVAADERSDIFSLGLVIYRMLTGEKAEGRFPDPSKLGCAPEWDAVVDRALAPRPEGRYASVADLAADVRRAGGAGARTGGEDALRAAMPREATPSTPPGGGRATVDAREAPSPGGRARPRHAAASSDPVAAEGARRRRPLGPPGGAPRRGRKGLAAVLILFTLAGVGLSAFVWLRPAPPTPRKHASPHVIDPLEEASRLEREARDLMAQAYNLGERGAMHAATGLLRMAEQKAGSAYESVEGIRGSGRAAGDPDADRRAAQLGTLLQGIRQEILRLEMQGKGRGGADAAAAAPTPDLLRLPRAPGFDDGAAPKPVPPGQAPGPAPAAGGQDRGRSLFGPGGLFADKSMENATRRSEVTAGPGIELPGLGAGGADAAAAGTGTIEVQSLPLECTVNIPSAGIRDLGKTMAKVTLSNVPAGTHAASFSATGKTLTHTVVLEAGAVVRLFVDFPSGKVVETAAENIRGKADASKALTLDLGGGVTMDLVLIPAGEFLMGSPESEPGRLAEEGPRHRVTIAKPFYLGKHEVTWAQLEQVTKYRWLEAKGSTVPYNTAMWDDAVSFADMLSKLTGRKARLPTEAEWEYACRAGTTTRFCFGDDEDNLGDYAWYGGNSGRKARPVGGKRPNAWGLHDMHGNVWEWCSDWHDSGYYAKSPDVDPKGPPSGSVHVARGSSWFGEAGHCRSAYRVGVSQQGFRDGRIGFRVVVEP